MTWNWQFILGWVAVALLLTAWFRSSRFQKIVGGGPDSKDCASCHGILSEADAKAGPCGDDLLYCAECKQKSRCGC